MRVEEKRAFKMLGGFTATAFGGMGWLCASDLSPASPQIWILTAPLILYILYIGSQMTVSWIDEDRYKCYYKPYCEKGRD